MSNQQLRQQMVEQIGEMADSVIGAKGEPFANVVGALFALGGMRDLGMRLIDAVPDALPLQHTLDSLHERVEDQILEALPEEERFEASNMAKRMVEKQRLSHNDMARS